MSQGWLNLFSWTDTHSIYPFQLAQGTILLVSVWLEHINPAIVLRAGPNASASEQSIKEAV